MGNDSLTALKSSPAISMRLSRTAESSLCIVFARLAAKLLIGQPTMNTPNPTNAEKPSSLGCTPPLATKGDKYVVSYWYRYTLAMMIEIGAVVDLVMEDKMQMDRNYRRISCKHC